MQTLNHSPTGREVSGAHKLSEVGVLIGFNFLPGGQKVKTVYNNICTSAVNLFRSRVL